LGEWRKAIPEGRDHIQSQALVWVVAPLLALSAFLTSTFEIRNGYLRPLLLVAVAISASFGVLVWRIKAGTAKAAACGALICFLLTFWTGDTQIWRLRSALAPLVMLFLLTFAATRAGYARKSRTGLAEKREGRSAAQVIANLGVAGVIAAITPLMAVPVLVLAALAEATADTVSSEVGQAFGGQPRMLTTFRRVSPGTDGAVTALGTVAGILAAALVAGTGCWGLRLDLQKGAIALAAGAAGLFFDSLVGATVERRGWLGNDLVNFSSTLFASLVALALLLIF
jgi:uncharacterized protein (TIGR00297 family)